MFWYPRIKRPLIKQQGEEEREVNSTCAHLKNDSFLLFSTRTSVNDLVWGHVCSEESEDRWALCPQRPISLAIKWHLSASQPKRGSQRWTPSSSCRVRKTGTVLESWGFVFPLFYLIPELTIYLASQTPRDKKCSRFREGGRGALEISSLLWSQGCNFQ